MATVVAENIKEAWEVEDSASAGIPVRACVHVRIKVEELKDKVSVCEIAAFIIQRRIILICT